MREDNRRLKVNVLLRARHADLIDATKRFGWTRKQFAEYLKITPSQASEMINLKWVPKKLSTEQERKLLLLTGKLPDELWPEFTHTPEFRSSAKTIEVTGEVTYRALQESGALQLPVPPDKLIEESEEERDFQDALRQAIGRLLPREQTVIQSLFFEGKNLKETAEAMGKSLERVRQIREKALYRLRRKDFLLEPFKDFFE